MIPALSQTHRISRPTLYATITAAALEGQEARQNRAPAWFLRAIVVGELLPGERVGEALGDFRQHRCVPRLPLGNDSVVDVLVALLKIGTLKGMLDHVEQARACSDLGVSRKSS